MVFDTSKSLSDAVLNVLRADYLVNKTSTTSYRRIHEVLVGLLDSVLRTARSSTQEAAKAKLDVGLAKVMVMIEYQKARGQLDRNLADVLIGIVKRLKHEAATARDPQRLSDLVERCRTFLDALVVLVRNSENRRRR